MAERMVESVIVFEGESVVGIITDRDILSDVVAAGLDPLKVKVSQIMIKPLATFQKMLQFVTQLTSWQKKIFED